eukprot:250849-Chlamydomonas_euryale.AAC.4
MPARLDSSLSSTDNCSEWGSNQVGRKVWTEVDSFVRPDSLMPARTTNCLRPTAAASAVQSMWGGYRKGPTARCPVMTAAAGALPACPPPLPNSPMSPLHPFAPGSTPHTPHRTPHSTWVYPPHPTLYAPYRTSHTILHLGQVGQARHEAKCADAVASQQQLTQPAERLQPLHRDQAVVLERQLLQRRAVIEPLDVADLVVVEVGAAQVAQALRMWRVAHKDGVWGLCVGVGMAQVAQALRVWRVAHKDGVWGWGVRAARRGGTSSTPCSVGHGTGRERDGNGNGTGAWDRFPVRLLKSKHRSPTLVP